MDNVLREKIKEWMVANKSKFVDDCGEFDYTKISEYAQIKFDTEDDEVFEIAVEVGG